VGRRGTSWPPNFPAAYSPLIHASCLRQVFVGEPKVLEQAKQFLGLLGMLKVSGYHDSFIEQVAVQHESILVGESDRFNVVQPA
jgi:hypothetical protein